MVLTSLLTLASLAAGPHSLAANALPQADQAFKGRVEVDVKDSTPDWSIGVRAPDNAPNIVLILLDDIGFSDTSTFGGIARTPELDKLAAHGLRYNNFNNAAMCSPTRAALLTGRNHHRVGFGIIANSPGGYPGYDSVWKKSTASVADVLRLSGYSTAAFGKWHNTPEWEITPVGPFDRWPTGLGFQYFYGFMGPAGDENQWEPTRLFRDTTPVNPSTTAAQGYHLTADLTNEAISWINRHESVAPNKPYFLYFATGAVHFPHQAPREWIDQYRGQFDQGWDQLRKEIFVRQKRLGVIPANTQLTARPPEVPAWSSLSSEQKRLYSRQMEVYAGFVAHTDHQVGRLLDTLHQTSRAENTIIIYIVGDNGASGEGGSNGVTLKKTGVKDQLKYANALGSADVPFNLYPTGWAWVGDTPFQFWKRVASHFGGTRNPLVISWPARIKDNGGIRGQFAHVNDIAATIYNVVGITPPDSVYGIAQQPLDGVSFAQTFADQSAQSNHHTQYFEMLGNRSIYHDGWVAAARHSASTSSEDRWELYHVANDFSESKDLARRFPAKLKELRTLFDAEAKRNNVYPLGGCCGSDVPSPKKGKSQFNYHPDLKRIPSTLLPDFGSRSYRITADVIVPKEGVQGVLAAYGDRSYGFVFYVDQGYLVYETTAEFHHEIIRSSAPLQPGPATLKFEFERDSSKGDFEPGSSGMARLYVNGRLSAQSHLFQTAPPDPSMMVMYLGESVGSPLSSAFTQPFKFNGTLSAVHIEQSSEAKDEVGHRDTH